MLARAIYTKQQQINDKCWICWMKEEGAESVRQSIYYARDYCTNNNTSERERESAQQNEVNKNCFNFSLAIF
jgi:hypothetical protein